MRRKVKNMHIEKTGQTSITNYKKKMERKSVSKMPIDSFVKSSFEEKTLWKISSADVFFNNYKEMKEDINKIGFTDVKNSATGETSVICRIDFDIDKKNGEQALKVVAHDDGTFSYLKVRGKEEDGKDKREYFLVKTDNRGKTLKEIPVKKAEYALNKTYVSKRKIYEDADIFGGKDGRTGVITRDKMMIFSPDGNKIIDRDFQIDDYMADIQFSPDGAIYFLETYNKCGNREKVLTAFNSDGSEKWQKKFPEGRMILDDMGNIYIYNKLRYKVITPDGKEGETVRVFGKGSKNTIFGSIRKGRNGNVMIIQVTTESENQCLYVKNGEKQIFRWRPGKNNSIADLEEGEDGTIYVLTRGYSGNKNSVIAIDGQGKVKWKEKIPSSGHWGQKKHPRISHGKDGNIYITVDGFNKKSVIPNKYRKVLPSKIDFDNVKSLILCLSPDGKPLWGECINDELERNKPVSLPDGNLVFIANSGSTYVLSKNDEYKNFYKERFDSIVKNNIREMEKEKQKSEYRRISFDNNKGIVNIGGVKLPISKR